MEKQTIQAIPTTDSMETPDAYRLFAERCMVEGKVAEVDRLCEEGLRFFPESDELRLYYGHCLTRLHQFKAAEEVLSQLEDNRASKAGRTTSPGLFTYRKNTAQGELYQRAGQIEKAHRHFSNALEYRDDWMPAHIGLIEVEIINRQSLQAAKHLGMLIDILGSDPALMLMAANLALISFNFEEADNFAAKLQGKLIGDDRFEHLLFQVDFFKGDHDSLYNVPYLLTGETVETEAARVWLIHFKEETYRKDASRIPEDAWREEYQALDLAWEQIHISNSNKPA